MLIGKSTLARIAIAPGECQESYKPVLDFVEIQLQSG
jgi:hypothetical protein